MIIQINLENVQDVIAGLETMYTELIKRWYDPNDRDQKEAEDAVKQLEKITSVLREKL